MNDQLPGFEEIDQYRNVTGVKGQATLAECIDRTIDDGVAHFAADTVYTSVEAPTPRQSYRLCEWRNCTVYTLAVVMDLATGEEHGACSEHVQDVRAFVEDQYRA